MKKILVTGATGFIGQYVVDRLLREGCQVIVSSAHAKKAEQAAWADKVTYIPFDLANLDPATDYYRFFGGPDSLVHLAWEGLSDYRSDFHTGVNLPRHIAFLKNLVDHGLTDLNVAGTCLEYGLQEGCLEEDRPALPVIAYPRAKNALRIFLEDLQRKQGFTLKWIRLFYMYGKGQNPKSLLSQLDKALAAHEPVFNMSGGEQIRDYLPVERLAEILCRISLQQETEGIINCCSGIPVTVMELVQRHLKDTGGQIRLNAGYYPYPDYEPMYFWGDTTKLKTII
ncbi:MAG TPA: SDR family NAD(P)-dependent oxidoreductase [Puia sp.]|jgi:dTDP-6-deoxy-L-talose 4-dehydrogenase (NAD+)